jgi:hypothetical protein
MSDARLPAEVFFDVWNAHTAHLPRMCPITRLERQRGTGTPVRALLAARDGAADYMIRILGRPTADAMAEAERFADVAVEWTRRDGADRGALRERLAREAHEAEVALYAPVLSDWSDHPWMQA